MLKIAITGGAGSGKSTVARIFRELGAEVLDADAAARQAVAVGRPAWRELRRFLGPECFQPDGELDRARVARLVFSDSQARQRLNDIVHPRVARELKKRFRELARRGTGLVLVEVPLLYEAGLETAYDRVIVVAAAPEDQVRRLQERDGRGALEISGMLQAQAPLADKAARADAVVDNRGSVKDTRSQVAALWRELQHLLDPKREKGAAP
ncbi:MAG: dephospho-CoA kinase [Desulfobaccales bacterium]